MGILVMSKVELSKFENNSNPTVALLIFQHP